MKIGCHVYFHLQDKSVPKPYSAALHVSDRPQLLSAFESLWLCDNLDDSKFKVDAIPSLMRRIWKIHLMKHCRVV